MEVASGIHSIESVPGPHPFSYFGGDAPIGERACGLEGYPEEVIDSG